MREHNRRFGNKRVVSKVGFRREDRRARDICVEIARCGRSDVRRCSRKLRAAPGTSIFRTTVPNILYGQTIAYWRFWYVQEFPCTCHF